MKWGVGLIVPCWNLSKDPGLHGFSKQQESRDSEFLAELLQRRHFSAVLIDVNI